MVLLSNIIVWWQISFAGDFLCVALYVLNFETGCKITFIKVKYK